MGKISNIGTSMCGYAAAFLGSIALLASLCHAQPNDGIDWVTVGDTNNVAMNRGTEVDGRGSVPWQYRIGRTEVPTSLWVEFYSAVSARAVPLQIQNTPFFEPGYWGGEVDPTYNGPGTRFRVSRGVADAAMLPVGYVSWRECAVLCNWLHNGKRSDPAAFMNGAYDTSTFGDPDPLHVTDQATHNPDAKYWIPTFDEWLKAGFYDPNKNGTGEGGWWLRANRGDADLIHGPPGQGQANTGFVLPNHAERLIPLGAYPTVQSAYGLLDVSGGLSEFTETLIRQNTRLVCGSGRSDWSAADAPDVYGGTYPAAVEAVGVRIASAVPSCGTMVISMCGCIGLTSRRRRSLL
jgi:hypothetical protein